MNSTPQNRYSHKFTYTLSVIMILCGLILLTVRSLTTQESAVPAGDQMWKITSTTRFIAAQDTSVLHVALPGNSSFIKIVHQSISHPDITIKRMGKQKRIH